MEYKQSEIEPITILFGKQTEAIRILLIEDNPADVRLVREMLSEAKYMKFKMESAGSLTEGLKLLAKREFDVVLLDMALPDCQGLEVLEKVLVQAPTVPIVLLTGTFDEESLAIKALRKGAEDYLFKGNVDGNLLVRSIRYAIERKRLKNLEKEKIRLEGEIAEHKQMKEAQEALRESLVQLAKKNKYESIISSVTRSIHRSINLQDVLENAVESMKQNIDGVDNVGIFLVEGEEAVLRAHRGYPDWFNERVKRIPYPKGLTWKVIIEGKPRYCADVDQDTAIGPAGREVGTKSYASMPLRFESRTVGCITINSLKKNSFDEDELKLLEIVAQQIETAINNAKQAEKLVVLYEDINRRNKDLEVLNAITQAVHQSLDLEEVYNIALDMTVALENIDMAMIYLVDEDRKEAVLQTHRNIPEDYIRRAGSIPYPKGITWKVINSGEMINIEDAQKDPDIGPAGRDLGHHGILGIPITLEGRVIGVIWIFSYKEHKFSRQEIDLLFSIGNQIAVAIAKAKLYRELSKKNKYETIINTVTRSVHRSINLQDVLENAVEAMSENIDNVDAIAIYLAEGDSAVLRSYRGFPDLYIKRAGRIPYPKGFIWKTIIEEKPIYCADVDQDTVIGPAGREMGIKSYLGMPVHSEGKTVGAIGINSYKKNAFDREELKLLENVAQQIKTAINNAKQSEEIRKLNEELENRVVERTIQLEAANKELEAFSYSVSHDLRAPLRAIEGFSSILIEEYLSNLDVEGQRFLGIIRTNVKHMGQLIDDLLAFSRLGRQEIRLSEVKMEKLVKDISEEFRSGTSERGLEFIIKTLPNAYGDRAMIHQVFVNLLSNAVKFTRPKERAIIEIGGRIEGRQNVYYIKDNGVGFDMQYVDKLFGVFQRLHTTEEFEGTGVGLAIVQRVIHKHGGRVWAEGKVGEGAAFFFTLPKVVISEKLGTGN